MNPTREQVYVDRRPPAAKDNSTRLTVVAVGTVLALCSMALVFWLMAANAPVPGAEPVDAPPPTPVTTPQPTPTPTPSASAATTVPPAPPSNELVGNEWLLSPYAVRQDNGQLVVTGTLQNLATETRSAQVSVFVYVGGQHLATGTGQVNDIAAGQSVAVSLPSNVQWQPGDKVLLVVAQDGKAADTPAP